MGQGGNGGIALIALDAAAERFGRSALADPTMLGSALRVGDARLPAAEITALVRAARAGAPERMRETIEQDVGPGRALAAGIAAADPAADPEAATPARWACTMLGVILGYLPRKWAIDVGDLPAAPPADLPQRASAARTARTGDWPGNRPFGAGPAAPDDVDLFDDSAYRATKPARPDDPTVDVPRRAVPLPAVGAPVAGGLFDDSPARPDEPVEEPHQRPAEPVAESLFDDSPYGPGDGGPTGDLPYRAPPARPEAGSLFDDSPYRAPSRTADDTPAQAGEAGESAADLPRSARGAAAAAPTVDLPAGPGELGEDRPYGAERPRAGEPGELVDDLPYPAGAAGPAAPAADVPAGAGEPGELIEDRPHGAEPSRAGELGELVEDLPHSARTAAAADLPARAGEPGELTEDLPYDADRARAGESGELTEDRPYGAEPPSRAGEPGELVEDLPYSARAAAAAAPTVDLPAGFAGPTPPPEEDAGRGEDPPTTEVERVDLGKPPPDDADPTVPVRTTADAQPTAPVVPAAPPTVEVPRPPSVPPADHDARPDRRRGVLAAALAVVMLAAVAVGLWLTFSPGTPAADVPTPVTAMPLPPAPSGGTPQPGGSGAPPPAAAPADPRQAFRNPALLAVAEPYISQPGVTCAETQDRDANLREHVTCDLGRGWVGIFQEMRSPDLALQVRESYLSGQVLVDPPSVRSLRWRSVPDQPGVKTGIRVENPDQGEGLRIRFRDQQGKPWLYFDVEGTGLQAYLASPDPTRDLDDLRTYWIDPSR